MQSARPYRYRLRPRQRALSEALSRAAGERAYSHAIEVLDVRERLPGWAARRACHAVAVMGLS